MSERNNEETRMAYWLGQRDMIANIFLLYRQKEYQDDKHFLKCIANIYNTNFDGDNEPNVHVQHFLKNNPLDKEGSK